MILAYLQQSTTEWHSSIELIRMFGRDALNVLYKIGYIEVREGLNCKVIKLK